ncbi:MAG TPA: hypothetical protein VIB48_24380, partial [Acidimicrobiia bacterium]
MPRVSSWRATASSQAQNDFDGLVSAVLGFAQQQLGAHGEFFPFAAVVNIDGTTEMVAPDVDDPQPAAAAMLDACVAALTARRSAIRAAAVVSDVRLRGPETGDAIRVDLEHVEGHALTVLLPYTKRRRNKIDS